MKSVTDRLALPWVLTKYGGFNDTGKIRAIYYKVRDESISSWSAISMFIGIEYAEFLNREKEKWDKR